MPIEIRWLTLSTSKHHRLDFVPFLQHLGRMIDLARPGNVGDVDHAVEPFLQFQEGAVAGQVADLALDPCAGG
jgi:hypothetical protein